MALSFGADDIDGTVMAENVGTAAGVSWSPMRPEELARPTRDVGFKPAQRGTYYRVLRYL